MATDGAVSRGGPPILQLDDRRYSTWVCGQNGTAYVGLWLGWLLGRTTTYIVARGDMVLDLFTS